MQYISMVLLALQAIPIVAELVRSIITGSKYIVNVENLSSFLLKLGQVARIKELTPEFVSTIVPAIKEFLDSISLSDLFAELKTTISRM